jgi:hypothetical protein
VAEERAAVKGYREELSKGTLPRPRCPVEGCTRCPQRRGFRERTDVRDSLGTALGPLLIPLYRCLDHGCIPWLPACLLPYIRTVAPAVEEILDRYACGSSAAESVRSRQLDEVHVRRWVSKLRAPELLPWAERMLDALRPARAAPEELPAAARPYLWKVLHTLRRLTAALEERGIAVGSPLRLLWSRPSP